jgi:hypothetical protein
MTHVLTIVLRDGKSYAVVAERYRDIFHVQFHLHRVISLQLVTG